MGAIIEQDGTHEDYKATLARGEWVWLQVNDVALRISNREGTIVVMAFESGKEDEDPIERMDITV